MFVSNNNDNDKYANTNDLALPICNMTLDGLALSCDEAGLEASEEVAVSCCSDGAVWTTGQYPNPNQLLTFPVINPNPNPTLT